MTAKPQVYSLENLCNSVAKMFSVRGYNTVTIDKVFVIGKDHKNGKDIAVAFIDDDGDYNKGKVNTNIESLKARVLEENKGGINDTTSIYVHGYNNKRINDITSGHDLEMFTWRDFVIDRTQCSSARNFCLVPQEYAEMVKGYPMANKLSLLANDPLARYLGAKQGDILYYESLELTDVSSGVWVPKIRGITNAADLIEELAETKEEEK